MSEWISVKDRLPSCECLCINKFKDIIIGYLSDDFVCENDFSVLDNVTHWMTLPEPPKE